MTDSKTLAAMEEHSERERLRAEIRRYEQERDEQRRAADAAEDAAIDAELASLRQQEAAQLETSYPWNGTLTDRMAWDAEHPEGAWDAERVLEHVSPKRKTVPLHILERLSESELARFKAEHADLYRASLRDTGPAGHVMPRGGNVQVIR